LVSIVTSEEGDTLHITPELSNGNDTTIIPITKEQKDGLMYLKNKEYRDDE
jgi:hypothetical protein